MIRRLGPNLRQASCVGGVYGDQVFEVIEQAHERPCER